MSLPSKEELLTMPLTILEHQNIESQEEERIVQEILNQRRASMPVQGEIYRNDAIAANISTPEEEAKWQKIIDERAEALKPKAVVEPMDAAFIETQESPTEPLGGEPEPEENTEEVEQPEAVAKAFCQFCDSKGVRHKLNCTRPK